MTVTVTIRQNSTVLLGVKKKVDRKFLNGSSLSLDLGSHLLGTIRLNTCNMHSLVTESIYPKMQLLYTWSLNITGPPRAVLTTLHPFSCEWAFYSSTPNKTRGIPELGRQRQDDHKVKTSEFTGHLSYIDCLKGLTNKQTSQHMSQCFSLIHRELLKTPHTTLPGRFSCLWREEGQEWSQGFQWAVGGVRETANT